MGRQTALAGQNAPLAVNALLALTLLLSAAGMVLLARHLYGTAGGLLAAALYTWSPPLFSTVMPYFIRKQAFREY